MAKVYDLLSITDTSTRDMRFTLRDVGKNDLALNIDYGHAQLRGEMLSLIEQGAQFKRCLFSTHGNSGFIVFGREWIDTVTWYQEFYPRAFDRLFPFPNTKLLFNGCNIADGTEGWKFLEAAARSLLRIGGGTAIGWTSKGFASPFSGHVKHLWGDTRQVYVFAGGDSLRFYENWKLISEGAFPKRPY